MGLFSWVTSDTEKSIPSALYTDRLMTVFLLTPDGKAYREDEYLGYGEFGGVDVYELCASMNAKHLGMESWLEQVSSDDRRELGIFLELGSVYEDASGKLWAPFSRNYPFMDRFGITPTAGNYAEPVAPGMKTPNEYIKSGEWTERSMKSIGVIENPIKIVEDGSLSYNDVGASALCPNQGMV